MGELDAHFRLKDARRLSRMSTSTSSSTRRPTLGILTVNALVAATHVLIPIQSSYFALEGTDDLLETIDKIQARANPHLQILGAVHHPVRQAHTAGSRHPRQISKVFGEKIFKTRSARACGSRRARPTGSRSSPSRRVESGA